jgi:hypothetical protein
MQTLLFIAVFISSVLIEVVWTRMINCVVTRDATGATMWTGLLYLGTFLQTLLYVSEPWLIVPAMAGHMLGTYTTVKWLAKKEAKETVH